MSMTNEECNIHNEAFKTIRLHKFCSNYDPQLIPTSRYAHISRIDMSLNRGLSNVCVRRITMLQAWEKGWIETGVKTLCFQ